MKTYWLMALAALFLAGSLFVANPSFAQAQGGPRWGAGQGAGYGRGPGNANCPYYPGYQNRGPNKGDYQGWYCPRGGAQQAPATPPTQTPAPQSGK